ncbi:BMP family ABC transporter substrate-binding protein, partial [uncultured Bacteroides sp.]|uniref:BMP family ABC transporter substrate-binding protein n=1 Tax=uncultured Bacteroides sp. TaxID=162156 RepID=UPI002587E069
MKMKKNQLTMAILFATMLGFTACSDDDKVNISTVSITTTVDTTIEGLQLTGGTYTFENINTSVKTDVAYPLQSIELADGLYNVTFIGKGTYSQNGTSVEVDVQGVQQNVTVSGGSCKLELTVHVLNTGEPGFVIAEIFIPGTYNEAGKQYNGDQYVRIYNNSDKVLYADGLIFMESQFQTTQKYQSVDPDITTNVVFIGSWSDAGLQTNSVNSMISQNVDVIAQFQDSTKTIIELCEKNHIYTVGFHVDEKDLAPDVWLTGSVNDWSVYVDMVKNIISGNYEPQSLRGGFEEGLIDLAEFGDNVDTETQNNIETIKEEMRAGTFNVFTG